MNIVEIKLKNKPNKKYIRVVYVSFYKGNNLIIQTRYKDKLTEHIIATSEIDGLIVR